MSAYYQGLVDNLLEHVAAKDAEIKALRAALEKARSIKPCADWLGRDGYMTCAEHIEAALKGEVGKSGS